ncbi:MAG: porin [Alphaproteobacteria bacterium]|nr:porin [Alphaproteobacteria bacterium]
MMKKLLYGTTALVAAGLLSSGAYAADPIKLSVGGYFATAIGFSSNQDDGAGAPAVNSRSHVFQSEKEIIFSGTTTLDNGVKIGVNVQLEGDTSSDIIDESYVWFEGSWGKIQYGAEDDATYLLNVGATKATSFFYGVASPVFSFFECGTNALGLFGQAAGGASGSVTPANTATVGCFIGAYSPLVTGDREKLTYFTPKMSGFQFGISYTPNNHEQANTFPTGQTAAGTYSALLPDNNTGAQTEVISLGANWSGKLGDVGVRASAGYVMGNLEVNNAALQFEDRDAYILAIGLDFKQLTIGASYYKDDFGIKLHGDRRDYTFGATYKLDKEWTLGAEYANSKVEAGPGVVGSDEGHGFALGITYNLGAGASISAEIQRMNIDDNVNAVGAQNSGTAFVIGTVFWF